MSIENSALRQQVVASLRGGQAHAGLNAALTGFPLELTGKKPHGLAHSAWQVLEHMRFTLHDLLDFSTNPQYSAHKWPDDYWPKSEGPPSEHEWQTSVQAMMTELDAFIKLVEDENNNLHDPFPWGKHKETLLREALLAIDHNSYHTCELILLRRLLGTWKQ